MSVNGLAFTDAQYTQQSVWTAVDAYTLSHLHPSTPNSEVLLHALKNSRDKGLPDIASYPVLGKFFAMQCRALRVKHALEIGTLGGYTSIWLASENPGLSVTTIEVNPHHREVAQQNLDHAGLADRVDSRLGPALNILPLLAKQIAAGEKPRLGFAYIDADKKNNWAYLDQVIGMCEAGAVIFVDNIVARGALVDEACFATDEMVAGARHVVENVGKDNRVEGVVLQTVGEKDYDGVLMVVVK
ncbi:hypothetical protein LTR08_006014 [Meristemomyces frigidus]|nr:hypothetical protein LTR08_006014 [Meristemomyces frigidus]